jgi:hypothetical protein
LSRAVEISADRPGLQKFAPHFLYATLNPGVFCFGAISPAQKDARRKTQPGFTGFLEGALRSLFRSGHDLEIRETNLDDQGKGVFL